VATEVVNVISGGSNWNIHDYTKLAAVEGGYSNGDEPTDAIHCDGNDDNETTTYTLTTPNLEDITSVSVVYYALSEEGGSYTVDLITKVNVNSTGNVANSATEIVNNWADDADPWQEVTENFSTPPSPGDWDGVCSGITVSFTTEAAMSSREAAYIDYVEVTVTGTVPSGGGGGGGTELTTKINPEVSGYFIGGGVQGMALREYGVATTVDTGIRLAGTTDLAITSDWTPASGDVKVSKDGGALANITTLPSFSSGTNLEIDLSATEMQAARVTVHIVDQDVTKVVDDMVVVIETYGNASAEHPTLPTDVIEVSGSSAAADNLETYATSEFPADVSKISTSATAADNLETYATSEFPADTTKISGSATAADNLEAFYVGGFKSGTVASGSTTTEIRTNLTEASGFWDDQVIVFTSGTYINKAKRIVSYNNTNGACTVSALPGAPSVSDTFFILGVIE